MERRQGQQQGWSYITSPDRLPPIHCGGRGGGEVKEKHGLQDSPGNGRRSSRLAALVLGTAANASGPQLSRQASLLGFFFCRWLSGSPCLLGVRSQQHAFRDVLDPDRSCQRVHGVGRRYEDRTIKTGRRVVLMSVCLMTFSPD